MIGIAPDHYSKNDKRVRQSFLPLLSLLCPSSLGVATLEWSQNNTATKLLQRAQRSAALPACLPGEVDGEEDRSFSRIVGGLSVRVFCALSLLFRTYNLSTGPSVDRQLGFLRPVCCSLVRLEISVELPGRSRSVCVLANSLLRYRNASKTGARLRRSPSFESWHTIEKQCSGSWIHVRAHTDACFHVRVCVCACFCQFAVCVSAWTGLRHWSFDLSLHPGWVGLLWRLRATDVPVHGVRATKPSTTRTRSFTQYRLLNELRKQRPSCEIYNRYTLLKVPFSFVFAWFPNTGIYFLILNAFWELKQVITTWKK